ncbi:type II secretion system protein J [Victivallis sp. Marseille-Q1083]|uniref:PulJ/GspJ family protein n=1 Tax=Victivallis sp. Marseille-Q1083 TaxID=2717288 RepID=UPI0015887773|nr:prepilin-type N-terminal cleavage/methylation domain-containing protein [Victivallis sp. Marseille-Q1083]
MKYGKNLRRCRWFTLVELMVAMGVFSVLLLMTVQFFNSAQVLWVNADRKMTRASDARVALDLITGMLDNVVTQGSKLPFFIIRSRDGQIMNNRIGFVTNAPSKIYQDARSNTYLVLFWVDTWFEGLDDDGEEDVYDINNYLMISAIGDNVPEPNIFVKEDGISAEDQTQFFNVRDKVRAIYGETYEVVPFITNLNFVPLKWNEDDEVWEEVDPAKTNANLKDVPSGYSNAIDYWDSRPEALRVELSLLSEADFRRWKTMVERAGSQEDETKAAAFLVSREQTYSRTVYWKQR